MIAVDLYKKLDYYQKEDTWDDRSVSSIVLHSGSWYKILHFTLEQLLRKKKKAVL